MHTIITGTVYIYKKMDNYSGLYNMRSAKPWHIQTTVTCIYMYQKKGGFGTNTYVGHVCLFQPEYSHT